MTTLWNVTVQDLNGTRAVLQVETAHPDAGELKAEAGFALRMLYEPAVELDEDTLEPTGTGPLGDAITDDEIHDQDWVDGHADEYVSAVDVEDQQLTIEATDAKWLAHLSEGQAWHSAAY